MSPLQKLDKVLEYFSNHYSPMNFFFPEIIKEILPKEVSLDHNEILMILDKLEKDGYVKKIENFEERNPDSYSLTYEGLFFIKYQNGYLGRVKSIQIENRVKQRNDTLLILGTWLAGIGASALVIWEVYEKFFLK